MYRSVNGKTNKMLILNITLKKRKTDPNDPLEHIKSLVNVMKNR